MAPEQHQALRPVTWPAVANVVYLPIWLDILDRHAPQLGGVNVESLPTSVGAAIPLARGLARTDEGYVPGHELARRLAWVAGVAVCVALVRRGWKLETAPGRSFWISDGNIVARPIAQAEDVVFGRVGLTDWRSFCASMGLSGSIRELILQSRS